jgi:hypothetical protein
MTTSSARKHSGPGPASDRPPIPEPTFAERARTLVHLGRIGSLSTLSRKQPGFPFGSVMPYGSGFQPQAGIRKISPAEVTETAVDPPTPYKFAVKLLQLLCFSSHDLEASRVKCTARRKNLAHQRHTTPLHDFRFAGYPRTNATLAEPFPYAADCGA